MGILERKLRQKEEVRSSILQAAWDIVLQEGWQALSIRKIALAIEYSVPVIYDHFANKEAILLEFSRRGFQLLNAALEKSGISKDKPEEKIDAMAFAYWQFAFTHKEYYQLMYGLGMPTCETVRQTQELTRFTEMIMSPIKSMIDENKGENLDPVLKLHTFWSMLHGLISINMMGKDNRGDELNGLILKDFIRSFISGLKG